MKMFYNLWPRSLDSSHDLYLTLHVGYAGTHCEVELDPCENFCPAETN